MRKYINRWKELFALARKQSITMQHRMMLYFLCLIFAAVGFLVFVLLSTGTMFNTEQHVQQGLEMQLQNAAEDLEEYMNVLAGHTLILSEHLADEVEHNLENTRDISSFNNQPKKLLEIQKSMYPMLNTTLQVTQGSGAFAILDATTNTDASGAEWSRSGMYLKMVNISGNVSLKPQIVYFRGIPDIAREEKLQLHNRWNLEADIGKMPWYAEQLTEISERRADNCRLTRRMNVSNTWEDAVFMTMPILGSNREVYGSCGIEVSSLCFRILYPESESTYGSMFTVLAPVENGKLMLMDGLIGEQSGGYLPDNAELEVKQGRYFDTFETTDDTYIGLMKETSLKGMGETTWAAAVLMPKDGYFQNTVKNRYLWMGLALGFVIMMIGLSFLMSTHFVKPIINSLDAIKDETLQTEESSGISEIDELCRFVSTVKNENHLSEQGLPPNIEELFAKFETRAGTLSGAEHRILDYYIDGHEINEIPELSFISMSTVRTHNRNIYKKLEVASRDELMLYLDLLKRCGRIDRIRQKQETE